MECFQEWWIRGGTEEAKRLGALELEQGPDLMKVLVHPEEADKRAAEGNIQILRRRSIELEEALELWIQGHLPEELKWKRGTL